MGYLFYHRYDAILNKHKSLSIIIDGSDQASYGLPYFNIVAKGDETGHKMKLKLMGAILHGHGAVIFTQLENLATGSNYVIEVCCITFRILLIIFW